MDQSQVHLCPVCEGEGAYPPHSEKQRLCHGCDGKGWVVVWRHYITIGSGETEAPITNEEKGSL